MSTACLVAPGLAASGRAAPLPATHGSQRCAPGAPRLRQAAAVRQRRRAASGATVAAAAPEAPARSGGAPTDIEYDAVIIGSGMGGLSTAAQMAAKGAKVVVLEK